MHKLTFVCSVEREFVHVVIPPRKDGMGGGKTMRAVLMCLAGGAVIRTLAIARSSVSPAPCLLPYCRVPLP